MENMLFITSIKAFSRLRNKAQLFSSLADDHYHTRLLHSIEVLEIAKMIVNELQKTYTESFMVQRIDFDRLTKIALLHDIGHTPYGHIGERTLHKICSGEIKCKKLPNFKKMKVNCGFKHNINSGLLYKEYLIKTKKQLTKDECLIIDGIVKHTSMSYNKKKSDFGFSFINSGLEIEIKYGNKWPITIEGIIVSYADEIAQVYSDYLDLCAGKFDVTLFNKTKIFSKYSNLKDISTVANNVAKDLVNEFVSSFNPDSYSEKKIKKSMFTKYLKEFSCARTEIMKKNETISSFDFIKERNIIILFQHYFLHPTEAIDIFVDFKNRVNRLEISSIIKNEIANLTVKNFEEYMICSLIKNMKKAGTKKLKVMRKVLKTYIRTVAVYISKMTDSYADHKAQKIISSKNIDNA